MSDNYTGIFWNLERFFDWQRGRVARSLCAISNTAWTHEAYDAKLKAVIAVLSSALEGRNVAFIALAEVETDRIVEDIRQALGLDTLMNLDSFSAKRDLDGNDVALLYSNALFDEKPIAQTSITLNNQYATRDLLYCRLGLRVGGEMVLAAVHWPSRLILEGSVLRLAHAYYLRHLVQRWLQYSIENLVSDGGEVVMPPPGKLRDRWNTPILIAGDFNDEPWDESVRTALRTFRDSETVLQASKLTDSDCADLRHYLANKPRLYNPCWQMLNTIDGPSGTFYREGSFRLYDQVILSHSLIAPDARIRFIPRSVRPFARSPVFYKSSKVELLTRAGFPRGFSATDLTGVSDHLPLLFDLAVC